MIEALYREHADRVYSRLLFATGVPEVAADLTQATFERLLRQEPAPDPVARLNTVAEGLLLNYFRDSGRRPEFPAGDRHDLDRLLTQGQLLTLEASTLHEALDTAVREMPEPERDALILTDLRGLDVREAGDVLDVSHMTVHRRRESARALVRKELVS